MPELNDLVATGVTENSISGVLKLLPAEAEAINNVCVACIYIF